MLLACMSVSYVCDVPLEARKCECDLLRLELAIVVSCCVDSGN